MTSTASIHTLPIFRNTRVAGEAGAGRIPVDHQVRGERVKYWRELRGPKTAAKWETFPHFPVVLNADGSPWAPACMWLLDRARAKPDKVSTLATLAHGLRDYKVFLDEFGFEWDDFSAVDKYLRPTYFYKSHLQGFYDFDEMSGDDIDVVLSDLGFTAQEKRTVRTANEPSDECRRIEDYKRWNKYKDAHREFESFLGAHGVFMPSNISERFLALSPLIGATFQDFASGISDGIQAVGSQGQLATVGVPIMRELETLIRARLWSAAEPVGG